MVIVRQLFHVAMQVWSKNGVPFSFVNSPGLWRAGLTKWTAKSNSFLGYQRIMIVKDNQWIHDEMWEETVAVYS